MSSFKEKLLYEVLENRQNHLTDNYDELQCGKLPIEKSNLINHFLDKRIPLNKNIKFKRKLLDFFDPENFYKRVIDSLVDASFLYDLLHDEASKNLLVKIYAYKVLGYKKVRLPRNTPEYWEGNKNAAALDTGLDSIKIDFMNLELPLLDLSPIGCNIRLNTHPIAIACLFTQRQYEYHSDNVRHKPEKGDIVLDGGACWGDSTLYFSHEVGREGKVYSFEFVPKNLAILQDNINKNPHLASNIHIIQHPMWEASNKELFCAEAGPGSNVKDRKPEHQTDASTFTTIAIDDLVSNQQLPSVDFIKMDIEGSELSALMGAENTLKRFRPKLAISLYHKPEDFSAIPEYLHNLNLGYDFYLDHHTIHVWETVLHAVPRQR